MLSKVHELIDPHTGQWDEALLRSVFSIVDVNRILQIPLHIEAMEDLVVWNFTRSGTFSVRSAYHVQFDHQFGRHFVSLDSPGSAHMNMCWKDLWQLRLPGKIKHFGWKVLKGVLPCLGILAGRHIPLVPQCPLYKIGHKDIQYYLLTCSRATDVRAELGLSEIIQKSMVQDRSGSVNLEILLQTRPLVHEILAAELVMVAT